MTSDDHRKAFEFITMAMIGHIDIDKSSWSLEQFNEHSKSYYAMQDAAFAAMKHWITETKENK